MDTSGGGCLRLFGLFAIVGILLVAACGGQPTAVTPTLGAAQVTGLATTAATSGATPGQPVSTPAAAAPAGPSAALLGSAPAVPPAMGVNLIANGGADLPGTSGSCSLDGWFVNRQLQATPYGSTAGEPTADSPGPAERGACYRRMAIGADANQDPTALALSTATMDVPADTRRLEVNITLDYDGDRTTCSSVAYADSLSLVLSGG